MVEPRPETQRIERLMPLAQALASVDRLVVPVAPGPVSAQAAHGGTLAADMTAPRSHPGQPRALRDGVALLAEATLDASSYAPARVASVPVEVGYGMPAGTDAVAPFDAVEVRGQTVYAHAPLASGDGVLPAGADAAPGDVLCPAGVRIRHSHHAAIAVLGVGEVAVRSPWVSIVSVRSPDDAIAAAIERTLIGLVGDAGGHCLAPVPNLEGLDAARAQADAIIVIGGSGTGPRDSSVRELARHGRVAFHGVGLTPGETAAFGVLDEHPVLIVPARLDAALAVWITLGRRMMARLCGRTEFEDWTAAVTLTRKIASTLGLVEIVPVAREANGVVPLASGYLPLQALARSDGYVVVPAESEGFAAGARVEMRPWP
jgi:molybdopterin biosynthesis enzyme